MRPARIATTAERSGNGFRLNGAKGFVLDGHVADALIVAALTEDGLTPVPGRSEDGGRRGSSGRSWSMRTMRRG